jgi:hypothetical protein
MAAGARRMALEVPASLRAWLNGPLKGYADQRDDLARDETSRLSAYLRFGCVSPMELARAALPRPGVRTSAGSWPGVISPTRLRPPSRHFGELLADGDVACNAGNWQWGAGTGNNPRPGRVLTRCARRPGSIMTAITCAATSRRWPASARRTSTRPGSCPARTAGS